MGGAAACCCGAFSGVGRSRISLNGSGGGSFGDGACRVLRRRPSSLMKLILSGWQGRARSYTFESAVAMARKVKESGEGFMNLLIRFYFRQ